MPTKKCIDSQKRYNEFFGKCVRRDKQLNRLYNIWIGLRDRCDNPNNKRFCYYGARGIRYAPSWNSFIQFYKDMGFPPEGKTLDREDNNKGYCKANCRWATQKQQVNNRRNTVHIEHLGRLYTLSAFCEKFGLSKEKTKTRVRRGWTAKEILKNTRKKKIVFNAVEYTHIKDLADALKIEKTFFTRWFSKGAKPLDILEAYKLRRIKGGNKNASIA